MLKDTDRPTNRPTERSIMLIELMRTMVVRMCQYGAAASQCKFAFIIECSVSRIVKNQNALSISLDERLNGSGCGATA